MRIRNLQQPINKTIKKSTEHSEPRPKDQFIKSEPRSNKNQIKYKKKTAEM
jgi:hypothetical protein